MGPVDPTTSTAAPKSYAIPKLAQDRSNWIMWKSQRLAILAVGQVVTHHIEGTAREPPKIPTFPPNCSLTEDEEDHLEKVEKHWDNYPNARPPSRPRLLQLSQTHCSSKYRSRRW